MTTAAPNDWLHAVRVALIAQLSELWGMWREEGDLVIGPGKLAVQATETHDSAPGHVDIGFLLNRNEKNAPIIWDCVAGGPGDLTKAAAFACHVWAQTTAPTILELLQRTGAFADHAHGDETLGLRGWHSIHGPVLGYGRTDSTQLQNWFLENAVVPLLRERLEPALKPGAVHGVKFLTGAFGEKSIAEVRIDGHRSDACSEALFDLAWPKDAGGVARFFVLFVHPIEE